MSKYLYSANTLTNNEVEMPALRSSLGIQRQIGVLHELPTMPLQCEGREVEMPRKDLERRAKYARQYYLAHKNEKHEHDFMSVWLTGIRMFEQVNSTPNCNIKKKFARNEI